MKYFPFKMIVLCILLPAVLYGFSVLGLERYLNHRYLYDIEEIYIGDTAPLFSGARQLKDAVRVNIDRFFREDALPAWALAVDVLVTTKRGTILYPAAFQDLEPSILPRDPMSVARENYALLSEGLIVTVDVVLKFYSPLSLVVLGMYILMAVGILYGFYRSGIKKSRHEDRLKNQEINRLIEQEKVLSGQLGSLDQERKNISSELERIRELRENEKAKASSNESDLFEEIVSLDEKLKQNTSQQQQQLHEINALRERISNYEAEMKKGDRQKAKEADWVSKRFGAIYKNVEVSGRAVEGFVDLSDEMRIKAEEIIHRLNDEPDQVPIKRKVFAKKGRETVLEVLFSYNGRLYFRRLKNQTVEIMTIGTKNSQSKDLDYINKVARKANAL